MKSYTEYEYNEAGEQIKATTYNSDGTINHYNEYEYNQAGQLIMYKQFLKSGHIAICRIYGYNEAGQQVVELIFQANDNMWPLSVRANVYNEAGRKIRSKLTYPSKLYSLYEYNEAGQQIQVTRCDGAGRQRQIAYYNVDGSYTEREYNQDGQLVKTTEYNADGSIRQ